MNLITPTSLRVLRFLLEDPMGHYHEREVMRRTGVSAEGANQILHSFAKMGVLLRERRGRMFFYKANMESAVVREFKVLFTLVDISDLVEQIKPNAERIILFGSCAEGLDVKDSDIDLFVLTQEKSTAAQAIHKFNSRSDRRVAPVLVDPPGFSKLRREDKALVDRMSEGIVLWQKR